MALHYWDATDYTTTMEYPDELRKKEECDVKDPIDKLCFAVNEHYPWDFNFKKRWFGGKQVPEKFTTVDFFSPKKVEYTPTQKGMVEGKINPRSSENLFFKGNAEDEDKSWGVMSLFYQGMEVNPYQNWQKISEHPNMMDKNSTGWRPSWPPQKSRQRRPAKRRAPGHRRRGPHAYPGRRTRRRPRPGSNSPRP